MFFFEPPRRPFRFRDPVAPFFEALGFEEVEPFLGFGLELTVPLQREGVHEFKVSNPCRRLATISYP